MKLRMFLEAFLKHSHTANNILILLKLHSILFLSKLSSIIFYHFIFKLFKRQFFRCQERQLRNCRLTSHIVSRYHSKFCCFIASRVNVQNHALVYLTYVHNYRTLALLFLCVLLHPFVEVPFCWNVAHSKWLNHQIFIARNAVKAKRSELHHTDWLLKLMKNCWVVRLARQNQLPINFNLDSQVSQRPEIRTSERIKSRCRRFCCPIASHNIVIKNNKNLRYDVMASNG